MGAVIGLIFGVGMLSIWAGLQAPKKRASSPSRRYRLNEYLASAGLNDVKVSSFLFTCAATGVTGFLLVFAASRTLNIALVFGGLASYLPLAIIRGRARTRLREFAEVWPEAVDNLASAVRAGMSLPEALGQLGQRGPDALRPAFGAFALDYQVTGRFGESLDRLKVELSDPVGDRVVEALRIAREVGGGDLGRLLRNLSSYLRDDSRTRSELEARQAWAVNGARVAVSAPWILLLLMTFQPTVIRGFATPGGTVVLCGGALSCLIAYQLMMRIGRLPVERRILS